MAGLRVIVVVYYWPPAGGGGVQRWVRLVRHLREAGVEPVVVRPEGADYPLTDGSLRDRVPEGLEEIGVKIFEPYRALRKLTGRGDKTLSAGFVSGGKKGAMVRLLGFVRGNFFVPDARKYWVRPVVKALEARLKLHPADVVVTTGPPHSLHLIGRELKRKTGIRWVADFRDFWTDMDHEEMFSMGKRARAMHQQMERSVVAEADEVVCTAPGLARTYSALRAREAVCITNGFDEEDFSDRTGPPAPKGGRMTIGHYGTLGPDRYAPVFWDVLARLAREDEAFGRALRIELFGPTDAGTLAYIRALGLGESLDHRPNVDHAEAVRSMCGAHLLMVALNQNRSEKGRLPGKIFEYLASGRPVMGIGDPESDMGELMSETGAGVMAERDDAEGMERMIRDVWEGRRKAGARPEVIARFTGRQLAARYAEVLKAMAE